MNCTGIVTKRRVEVSIGVPDLLAGVEGTKAEGMAHPDESYFMTFVDVTDSEDGSHNSLSVQATCLCALREAAICWLNGGTEEEVKAVLVAGHEDEDDHGEDWKKS